MQLPTRSITKRIYFSTVLIFGVITFIFILFSSYRTMVHKRLEYETNLYVISGLLGSHITSSFEDILAAKGALEKPVGDQVLVLNSVLQPIVDEIYKQYPNSGMGYYSIKLDRNLAIQPNFSSENLISKPHDRPYFKVYETGKPMLTKVTSESWGSPVLSYTNPIYDKEGEIVGHSWANINLHEMYEGLIINVTENLTLGVLLLLLIVLMLRTTFNKLSKEINDLATAVVSEKIEAEGNLLPELQPIFLKIKDYITKVNQLHVQDELINQLTYRLKLEEDLASSNQRNVNILKNMGEAFFVLDNKWCFLYFNKEAERLSELTSDYTLGKSIWDIVPNISEQRAYIEFHSAVAQGLPIVFEAQSLFVDSLLEYRVYPSPLGLEVYLKDITQRKEEEEQKAEYEHEIARLDRFNLIGQMAAGIGHEIRNPMTTVRGYLQLLGEKPECDSQRSRFELMISELDRANFIITEFLSLAKIKPTQLIYRNINDLITNLYPLLEADANLQSKQLVFEAGDTPDILIDTVEISQLIINLCRNGLEAMNEQGLLTLRTYQKGTQVILCVEDEGCGISPGDLEKVGTPFFTTKDIGTGLGLAICYSIAERHNAVIDIETGPKGTVFTVRFTFPQESQGVLKSA